MADRNLIFPKYDLGERIKHLRNERKLSQSALAKAARVSQPTIAQIESGNKDPSIQTIKQIARVLDIDLAALFAADEVFVFDLKRLRRKYSHVDKLTPHLYVGLSKVLQYAKEIKFFKD